jgi:hypothetical protein
MNLIAIVTRRGQKQVKKVSLAENHSLSIGRAWNSDIVIDDKYVDATHATLTLDRSGTLTLEDSSSTNGTRVNKKALKGIATLASGARIAVGDTQIQILNGDMEVAPTVRCGASQRSMRRLSSTVGVVLTTLGAAAAMLFSIYVLQSEEATADAIAEQFIMLAALFAGWCLVAGILGKVFRGETNFLSHWVLLCLAFCSASLVDAASDVVQFSINSDLVNLLLNGVLGTLFLAVFCYVTLSLMTNLAALKKLPLAGLLAALPFTWQLLQPQLADERDNWTEWVTEYQNSQPPGWVFAKPTTIDEHMQGYNEIFARLEQQVAQSSESGKGTVNKETRPLQLSEIK